MFTSSDLRGECETPALARDIWQRRDMEVISEFYSWATELESPRKEGIAQAAMAAVGIPTSQMMTTGDTAVTKSQTRDTAEGARD